MRAQGLGSDTHSNIGDFNKITPKSGKKIIYDDFDPISPGYSPTYQKNDKHIEEQEYFQPTKSQISDNLSDYAKTPKKSIVRVEKPEL